VIQLFISVKKFDSLTRLSLMLINAGEKWQN